MASTWVMGLRMRDEEVGVFRNMATAIFLELQESSQADGHFVGASISW